MSSLKGLGILGTGTIGVLGTGLIVSNLLSLNIGWLFGFGLIIFVSAGAIALLARSGVLPV